MDKPFFKHDYKIKRTPGNEVLAAIHKLLYNKYGDFGEGFPVHAYSADYDSLRRAVTDPHADYIELLGSALPSKFSILKRKSTGGDGYEWEEIKHDTFDNFDDAYDVMDAMYNGTYKPGTKLHELTEPLEEKIDEADGKKDGKFSVHDMDSDDGNHDDNINVSVLADAIRRGPGYTPHYDEDGNKIGSIDKIVESVRKSAEDLAGAGGWHASDLEGKESSDKPRKKSDYLSDSNLKNIINNMSVRPGN